MTGISGKERVLRLTAGRRSHVPKSSLRPHPSCQRLNPFGFNEGSSPIHATNSRNALASHIGNSVGQRKPADPPLPSHARTRTAQGVETVETAKHCCMIPVE
jgi:hypothetical protein